MGQIWRVFFVFFLVNNAKWHLGKASEHCVSSLGGSVILSASQHCGDVEELKIIRRLKDDTPTEVGRFDKRVWMPAEVYQDRVRRISGTSVVLNNVTYNDNGVYEFVCVGGFGTLQLDVVVPSEVVTEGEPVKLPSHFITAGEHDMESIRWEKNGELVFESNLSGNVSYGTGFEGRVSLSPDWISRGDLSLTLERVQPEDEGDFFIYLRAKNGKRKMGNPAAVRLKFKKKNATTPLPGSPRQSDTGQKQTWTWAPLFITAAVMFVVVAPLAFWLGWWLKSRRTSGHGDGRPSTDVEMGTVIDTGHAGCWFSS